MNPGNPPLLTLGYEGLNLDAYLDQLARNKVTLLCDVRRNPISRKRGFSKGALSTGCAAAGIRYEHLPELGIASDKRKGLATPADYAALFAEYEGETLPRQQAALQKIVDWMAKGERVALTCFERHPAQCHRHCVAKALEGLVGPGLSVLHLSDR